MTTSDLPDIYRLPLRSQKEGGVPHDEQVEHCLRNGLSALGWGVDGGSLEEVLKQIEATYDRRGAQTVERFANAPTGSLIWTLHTDGTYRVGELTGQWRYDPIACPYCGNAERSRITSFTSRDGRYRIYACDECQRYLKAFDGRDGSRPALLAVDSIATLPLDAAAIQRGYQS